MMSLTSSVYAVNWEGLMMEPCGTPHVSRVGTDEDPTLTFEAQRPQPNERSQISMSEMHNEINNGVLDQV